MKILFVSHEAEKNGAPFALYQELQVFKDKIPYVSVDVLFLKDGPLRQAFYGFGNVLCCNTNSYFHRILRFLRIEKWYSPYIRIAKQGNYDLIYANTVASLPVSVAIKNSLFVPLLAHIHESEYLVNSYGLNSKDFLACDSIIAVSTCVKNNLVENYGVNPDKVVVQHPISPQISSLQDYDEKTGSVAKPDTITRFRIGMSGSHGWVKSMELIPQIIKMIIEKYPDLDFELVAIGLSPELKYRIMYDLKRMGYTDRVELHGLVDNPIEWFKSFDVFLLLSREDSFPLAAEENAALAKPIVAFDNVTGVNEWLSNDSAYMVPYLDLNAVSDAVYTVYSDYEDAEIRGKKAYESFKKMYKENQQMMAIITEIMKYDTNS